MPVLPLHCLVQKYAWGSPVSIPTLTKQPNPDLEPWAELWMGAHPKACSTLPGGESLSSYIRDDPRATLGSAAGDFDGKLPFLFKILAAARPLSIQCHPNLVQAKAGFAADNAAGLPLLAPNRNYRDDNHKPELIVALGEFWALKGFRAPSDIEALLKAAKLASTDALLPLLKREGGLADFFHALWTLPPEASKTLLGELAAGLSALPEDEARWTAALLEEYPSDVACVSPLLLQLVELQAGEGLYLGAGELHAYLQGTGLEIMANSDNVLRGGLTKKHMDLAELMRVLRFEHRPLAILRGRAAEGQLETSDAPVLLSYRTPSREFALHHLKLQESTDFRYAVSDATIFLSLGGDSTFRWDDECLELAEGGVAFASADTESVRVRGNSSLWIATIGSQGDDHE